MKPIKVLIVEPKARPYVAEINSDLDSLQELVGGYIELICPPSHEDDVVLIGNEEAKILGLEMNRPIRLENGVMYDIVCGTFIICRAPFDSDDFESLTDEQIETYTKLYYKDYHNDPVDFMQLEW